MAPGELANAEPVRIWLGCHYPRNSRVTMVTMIYVILLVGGLNCIREATDPLKDVYKDLLIV